MPNSISEALGVNGLTVCDCGHQEFRVGLQVEGDENHIRVLECCACKKQMAVPFQANVIERSRSNEPN